MSQRNVDPTHRFSTRVENYVRYRPGYPADVSRVLADEMGFSPVAVVADVGAGTGISSRLFLDNGNTVYAVEPNDAMRQAAETLLRDRPRFHSVIGTAEQTTLADQTVDYIVAGQAFHWFDIAGARREFAHILRSGGWVVLMWNTRKIDTTPFLRGYEKLLLDFGTDYQEVNHANISDEAMRQFFGTRPHYRALPNEQVFDLAGLTGRLLSSSYVPGPNDPRHGPMLAALAQLFDAHHEEGHVRFSTIPSCTLGILFNGDRLIIVRQSTFERAPMLADFSPLSPGTHRRTIDVGGRERSYLLHVPPSYDPGRPLPLVLAFHGARPMPRSWPVSAV